MYQTSQRNWVTIKVHYRYLRKYLLFYADRDWNLSLRVNGEVSLGPLGRTSSLCAQCDQGVDHGMCVTQRVKRLAGNEIEQGIGIPTIESRASTIPIDKGNCIRD